MCRCQLLPIGLRHASRTGSGYPGQCQRVDAHHRFSLVERNRKAGGCLYREYAVVENCRIAIRCLIQQQIPWLDKVYQYFEVNKNGKERTIRTVERLGVVFDTATNTLIEVVGMMTTSIRVFVRLENIAAEFRNLAERGVRNPTIEK